jgi:serine phosphatase RsbU (regulator of sigma subunit)
MGAPKIAEQGESLGFKVRIVAGSDERGRVVGRELEQALQGWIELGVSWGAGAPQGGPDEVLFVDARTQEPGPAPEGLGRGSRFLIVGERDEVPAALVEGYVDDVLVHPFRGLEVLSKLRAHQKWLAHREALELNESYAKLVQRLQDDLRLAEKLQKQKLPRRFPEVKGFKVTSRYLAGERSGGDYVDLGETRDGQSLAIVMTDASTYRLSSAVLDTISRRLSNLPPDETRSCVTAARRIRDGVLISLGERDHLSLFYAVLNRKDYRLRFLNLGSTRVFYAPPSKPFAEVSAGRGDPIVRAMSVRTETEGELTLEPEGRLALVSDGFVDAVGGGKELLELLDQRRGREAADTLNELVFRTRKALSGPDELPAQDCTAVLFDVDSRLIRLA